MTTYRAAYVNDVVLTGPEHAHLSDEDLIDVAVAQAKAAGILGEDYVDSEDNRLGIIKSDVKIGPWTDGWLKEVHAS
jgi:hypothetical protein